LTGTAETARLLIFDGTALMPATSDGAAGDGAAGDGAAGDGLAAADSWLVNGGRARFLDAHRDRFLAACASRGQPDGPAFWAAATDSLPREGRWFPRAELTAAGTLRLRIRPAPPLGRELAVRLADQPDPRREPRIKGPDLPALGRLRDRAVRAGADEVLLTTHDGIMLEGATTSLLWWEQDELCVPDPALPVLPGVTTLGIQRHARAAGVTVRPERATIARLAGRETWLVNALHGIRPVVAWPGESFPAGSAPRVASWKRWLGAEENLRPLCSSRRLAPRPPG
jgi:branched-subunit amino acid aminotransferase/4-amino-4-deoxychorismate lyase